MRKLTPIIDPVAAKGYIVKFRHPLQKGNVISRGLETQDFVIAQSICCDALLLFRNPRILQAPTAENLRGYDERAVRLVFGDEHAAALLEPYRAAKASPLSENEALKIADHVEAFQENLAFFSSPTADTPT